MSSENYKISNSKNMVKILMVTIKQWKDLLVRMDTFVTASSNWMHNIYYKSNEGFKGFLFIVSYIEHSSTLIEQSIVTQTCF